MKIGELSRLIGVSDHMLRRLVANGIIPAKRLPGPRTHWNFAKADVKAIRTTLVNAGVIEESPAKQKKK